MRNQELRRVVHAEEEQQAERRRQQLAQAASTSSCASNSTAPVSEVPVEASLSTAIGDKVSDLTAPDTSRDDTKPPEAKNEATYVEEQEDDDDYLQKHLLSRPTSAWTCLEDTQQANCLALNASHTLMAVGERDGRVTIWDNTTIRVITRELDPTLIAMPAVESPSDEKVKGQDDVNGKTDNGAKKNKTDEGDAEGSGENDDASVEDEEEERTEDAGSVEEDVATEEDEEVETEDNNESEETKTEDEADTAGGGIVLTLADLRVVKTALKVVSQ
ncbi:Hypothetical protein PHPALM_15975 [Phytophthora palmivora]|uniref:Uncharacterized protein n=1 Tax=Phytophthora palmivora TaxID=4796 RepID=A0A2P4XQX3_9STRA|nr:Hypothetical protein PHPALM_15975 [Phytophthora palmivora]